MNTVPMPNIGQETGLIVTYNVPNTNEESIDVTLRALPGVSTVNVGGETIPVSTVDIADTDARALIALNEAKTLVANRSVTHTGFLVSSAGLNGVGFGAIGFAVYSEFKARALRGSYEAYMALHEIADVSLRAGAVAAVLGNACMLFGIYKDAKAEKSKNEKVSKLESAIVSHTK